MWWIGIFLVLGFAAILLAIFFVWVDTMSELDDVKASIVQLSGDVSSYVSTVSTEFGTLAAQIAALTAQINAGVPATAQDLVDLKTQVDAVDAAIKAAPVAPAP